MRWRSDLIPRWVDGIRGIALGMNDVSGFRGVFRHRECRAALTTRDVPLGSFWCDGGFPDERCIFGPF